MIRAAAVEDLPALHACALEFYATSRFLGKFSIDRFCMVWERLLSNGTGVIFVDERGGKIVGTIGGLVHEDLYDDRLIAAELFWFAQKEHRGSGVALYAALEKWAKAKGAESLQMGHLLDSMPEKVARFYRRAGYVPVETRYTKDLR